MGTKSAQIKAVDRFDYEHHFDIAIDLCPDGCEKQQTAIALALKAMYMQGRADEAVEAYEKIEWE